MGKPVAALLGMICLVATTACSGDSAADPAPSKTPTSAVVTTSSSPAATTPATPKPPEMPSLAKEKSTAGAKAFVRYYVEALNYSWTVGRGTFLRTLSTRSCGACQDLADVIDRFAAHGGYQRGAEWRVDAITLVPTQPLNEPIARCAVRVAIGSWRASASTRVHRIHSALTHDDFHLAWTRGQWRMMDVVPQ